MVSDFHVTFVTTINQHWPVSIDLASNPCFVLTNQYHSTVSICFICYFQVICLTTLAAEDLPKSVRRMMGRIATNRIWSLYSLKGRLGKDSFSDLPMFTTLMSRYNLLQWFVLIDKQTCIELKRKELLTYPMLLARNSFSRIIDRR